MTRAGTYLCTSVGLTAMTIADVPSVPLSRNQSMCTTKAFGTGRGSRERTQVLRIIRYTSRRCIDELRRRAGTHSRTVEDDSGLHERTVRAALHQARDVGYFKSRRGLTAARRRPVDVCTVSAAAIVDAAAARGAQSRIPVRCLGSHAPAE